MKLILLDAERMTKDEYVLTLVAIIVGYLISIYLETWAYLINQIVYPPLKDLQKNNKKQKISFIFWKLTLSKLKDKTLNVLFLWSILSFFTIVQFWLAYFETIQKAASDIVTLMAALGYVFLLYAITFTIYPSELRTKKIAVKDEAGSSTKVHIKAYVTTIKPLLYWLVSIFLIYASFFSFFFSEDMKYNLCVMSLRVPALVLIIYERIYKKSIGIGLMDILIIFTLFITLIGFLFIRSQFIILPKWCNC